MSLNRREMLRLGAAGAGSFLLTSAASGQALPSSVFARPAAPLDPLAPPAPGASAPAGIDPALFQRAKAALNILLLLLIEYANSVRGFITHADNVRLGSRYADQPGVKPPRQVDRTVNQYRREQVYVEVH